MAEDSHAKDNADVEMNGETSGSGLTAEDRAASLRAHKRPEVELEDGLETGNNFEDMTRELHKGVSKVRTLSSNA